MIQKGVAAAENDVRGTLGIGNGAVPLPMEGRHHFPPGIEGQFIDTGLRLLQGRTGQAKAPGQIQKRQFRRVSQSGVRIPHSVIAESQAGEKKAIPGRIQPGSLHQPSVAPTGGNGHAVLGQSAGLVGTDDADTAQGFHAGKAFYNGMDPHHAGDAQSQDQGYDSGQALRNGCHRQRNRGNQHFRQIELLEEGKKVVQETRRWDDNKESSHAMRSKEDAQDYRYFPEPDLPPIDISEEWLEEIKARQPELRTEKLRRYREEFEIPEYDAQLLTASKQMADMFEAATAICGKPKKVSNWLMVETMRLLKENGQEPEDLKFSPEHLAKLVELADGGTINSSVAKEVFEHIFYENVDPEQYVEEKGLKTVNDEGALRKIIEDIVAVNPQSVADYKGGKEKALGFLVGQTMKEMKGKANPGRINEILKELLQ